MKLLVAEECFPFRVVLLGDKCLSRVSKGNSHSKKSGNLQFPSACGSDEPPGLQMLCQDTMNVFLYLNSEESLGEIIRPRL